MSKWLILFILLSNIAIAGDICVCGGGSIPHEAVKLIKDNNSITKPLLVSPHEDFNKRWDEFFDSVTYCTLEDFSKLTDLDFDLLILEGGNQFEYLQKLDRKKFETLYNKSIPIFATSAGSMILGGTLFTAEHGSVDNTNIHDEEKICLSNDFLKVKEFENTIIDTHYTERSRRDRLKIFMERSKVNIGIGIDEGTALCLINNKKIVCGAGNVEFINKGI